MTAVAVFDLPGATHPGAEAVLAGIDEAAAARCLASLIRSATVNPPGYEADLAAHLAEGIEALDSARLGGVAPRPGRRASRS